MERKKIMTKEEQVEIIKFKIKHEIEYLEELVERRNKARKEFHKCYKINPILITAIWPFLLKKHI